MKIALVSPYDFAYPGGVTNHISYLERHFTKMGHEVKIIAPASEAVSNLGDRFILVGKPRPIPVSGSIARITISPWLSSRIKTVLDREKFDIIHLHEPLMPMLCTTVLRLSINKHFPGYYNIIPNGVDLEYFSPDVSPIDKFCDGKLNILFAGRLEKTKRIELFA